VVVVEGKLRSGSLITARLAADFGRTVFAVPGRVDSELAQGPHHLIREGAILAEHPGQVLEDAGLVPLAAAEAPPPIADPTQAAILDVLRPSDPLAVDEILVKTGLEAPPALGALLALELSGRVKVLDGRRYVRAT
jgi:DNA processing protein